MVYRVAVAAGVKITPSMATCLYTAVLSDTGSFTYPLTTANTFGLAHALTLAGANPSQIARDLLFTSPLSKIKLLGTALSNMECDRKVAWSWVTQQDMDQAKADAEDCEGVVNHLISIAGVESAVFFRELPEKKQVPLEHPQQRARGCLGRGGKFRRRGSPHGQRMYLGRSACHRNLPRPQAVAERTLIGWGRSPTCL